MGSNDPGRMPRIVRYLQTAPSPARPAGGKESGFVGLSGLERDDFSSNRHPALALLLEHDLFRKPVPTFRDHALKDASGKMPSRLLHVLVHVDGTVDHHHPDHHDRDKPNNQRCHVSSPTPLHPHHRPNSRRRNCGTRDQKCTGRGVPRRTSDRHLAKRDVLSGEANVEPEHWSMGAARALPDALDAYKASDDDRIPLCTAAKNSINRSIMVLETGAARHKFSVNTICFSTVTLRLNLRCGALCVARNVLTFAGAETGT